MTFSYTKDTVTPERLGRKKMTYGTFNCASVTGGDIDTGLLVVENFQITENGTAVTANAPVVNESFPTDGSAITIVTDSGAKGTWVAFGY
jgi:hypothetical protein